jgi:hypothetical protein
MTARGEARTPGRVVCCDIQRKVDDWYLSLVVVASVRLRVRGNTGPCGGAGDACGRSETNRSGTDLGSRKRA